MATATGPFLKRDEGLPSLWQRVLVLTATATILLLSFHYHDVLPSRSERVHAMMPWLWLVDVLYYQRHRENVRWGFVAAVLLGLTLGLLYFFWNITVMQARMIEGRADWKEPFSKLFLVASLLVLYTILAAGLTWVIQIVPAAKKMMTEPRGWWLRLIRQSIAILLFAPYLFTAFNIHRFKIGNAVNPQSALHLPYEAVAFPVAKDDLLLKGWFIPRRKSTSVVLVCHGVGANKANFLQVVPFLHRAGFNVLLFDFRGHGDSPGHTISFGYYEARDVKGAVRYLKQRGGINNIVALAYSMGGSALLNAMPALPEIRGVIVDSAFAEFKPLAAQQFTYLPAGLGTLMLKAVDFDTKLELGIHLSDIAPRRHIGAISPRPLLIIHGTADTLIPPAQARLNYDAAREPKSLWLVPGANHVDSYHVARVEYERRVTAFFRECIEKQVPK